MTTKELVDPLITDFDNVEPTCEVDEISNGVHGNECANPAVWLGVPPCGHDGFFCEQHHSDSRSFECRMCGNTTLLATYRWIRL